MAAQEAQGTHRGSSPLLGMELRSWARQWSRYHESMITQDGNAFTYSTLHMPRDDRLGWCDTQSPRDLLDLGNVERLFD